MTTQSIATRLSEEIIEGDLPPGTPLAQTDLAQRFGVSRIPIRDALAQLAASGVITAAPNKTATVIKLSGAEIEEAYAMRILLECDLMACAMTQMTPKHLEDIDIALERSSLEARQANWAEGDEMFHTTLYAAANRPRQLALVNQLRRQCRIQIAGYKGLTDKTHRWLKEHQAIVEACKNGDIKGAKRGLRRHLKGARNHLMRAIKSGAD